jgi:hypothetical protein
MSGPARATIKDSVDLIVRAATWDERIARLRQIPQRYGTSEHAAIYAKVAERLYVPHLAPDYAYVHSADFYELPHFHQAYEKADAATSGFTQVSVEQLTAAIQAEPTILLPNWVGCYKRRHGCVPLIWRGNRLVGERSAPICGYAHRVIV